MDIDKKIAEWELLRWDKTGKLGEMAENGRLMNEFFDCLDQLKECREELAKWDSAVDTAKKLGDPSQQIEQRIKDACKEEVQKIPARQYDSSGYTLIRRFDVEQAIESAEVRNADNTD